MATITDLPACTMTDEYSPELEAELANAQQQPRPEVRPHRNGKLPPSSAFSPYDPIVADQCINASNLVADKRFWQMAKTLASLSVEAFSDKIARRKLSKSDMKRRRAARLRQALVDLGPTFIKLGQFLSVRRDCLPPEIADELALLQDKVPPFDIALVKSTITSDLGQAPELLYDQFEEEPIASASIGQVHLARLKDGRQVVVKVQRPDLSQIFYQDLGYMRLLARWGVLIRPQGQWDSWIALSDEFGRTLFQEIDYLQEGRNADRIRHVLRNQTEMRIPRVYWKFTGRRVLTLEYLPGTKIDKVAELEMQGLNLARIGNLLVSCYLEQVLLHGFFHADPHAGNLSVDSEGRVIIYDFGMMGEITEAQRDAITGCIVAVIQKDTSELVKHLTNLGVVKEGAKMGPVTRAIEPFIDYYAGKELRDLDFTALEHDIDQIAFEKALCMPPTLAYLLRAGSTLEGIARTLKPNFSFVEASKPSLKKWILSRPGNAAALLKVFFNGNLRLSEDAVLKIASGKSPLRSVHVKGTESKNKSEPTSVDAKIARENLDEIEALKSKVYLLETQVKSRSEKGVNLIFLALWLLAFAVTFATLTFLPEYRPYANIFLIGNGVMGAIIMWHLVAPDSLARLSKKPGHSRGQRR